MKVMFADNEAWVDYISCAKEERKRFDRINKLIDDIKRNGNLGLGHPEPLKGNSSGFWSRRIDEKHRLVYRIIDEDTVEISRCKGHYEDK